MLAAWAYGWESGIGAGVAVVDVTVASACFTLLALGQTSATTPAGGIEAAAPSADRNLCFKRDLI